MSTDIHGAVEVRSSLHDGAWIRLMDLFPLYAGADYEAFGCLFGVRNRMRWEPVAAFRGLPADVSAAVRQEYESDARLDDVRIVGWFD